MIVIATYINDVFCPDYFSSALTLLVVWQEINQSINQSEEFVTCYLTSVSVTVRQYHDKIHQTVSYLKTMLLSDTVVLLKYCPLACWWWRFDWSWVQMICTRLTVLVVITISITFCCSKTQNGSALSYQLTQVVLEVAVTWQLVVVSVQMSIWISLCPVSTYSHILWA